MEKYRYNDIIKTLEVDPFCLKDGLLYAKNNNLDKIRVIPLNHYAEYGFTNANQLYKIKLDTTVFKDFSFIKALTLEDYIGVSNDGIDELYNLKLLEYFSFQNKSVKPDLNNFPNIETFVFKYNDGVKNLNCLKKLKNLMIFSLNTNDCSILSGLANLNTLSFIRGSFSNLNGIEHSKSIRSLDINYNSNIDDISFINNLTSLEILKIEKCKKLKDYNFLSENESIKELFIDSLDSLAFIPSMKKLEKINFWDCKDGNMTPLVESRSLRQINFYPNKKHYSHTIEQIIEKTGARRGRNK
jgi:internalin A